MRAEDAKEDFGRVRLQPDLLREEAAVDSRLTFALKIMTLIGVMNAVGFAIVRLRS
jgi:hypothetical protein